MEKNKANTARRLASQRWGEVNAQKKVMSGVWWFSCSGHGGYVVDLCEHPGFAMHYSFVETRLNSGQGYTDEQHYAILEEDCNAVMFDYLYYDYLEISKKRLSSGSKEDLRHSLQRWNATWLAAYDKARECSTENIYGLDYIIESLEIHSPMAYTTAKGVLTLYYYWRILEEEPDEKSRFWLRNAGFVFRSGILPSIPQLENGFQFQCEEGKRC